METSQRLNPEAEAMADTGNKLKPPEGQPKKVKISTTTAGRPSVIAKDDDSGLPIDRGYAWVVVFACLFSNIICLGLQRAYGILFVEFLHLYNLPVAVTSLVMAIQSAFTSVAAFLTQTVMLSILSERQTMIIGGLCGGVGLILSYFASTLFLLILTQSVIMGTANGMVMGPTMVIVGKYFHKRRSFAMAVSTLGGNLGSMVMPLFTQALLTRYGVRGTLLILGATFLNIMVFAGLLRPLEHHRPQAKKGRMERLDGTSVDNKLHSQTVLTKSDRDVGHRSSYEHSLHTSHLLHTSHHLHTSARLCISTPDLFVSSVILGLDDDQDPYDDDDEEEEGQELQPLKNATQQIQHDTTDPTHVHPAKDHHNGHHKTGSISKLQTKRKTSRARFWAMFDFSLFKRPPFLLVVAATSLGFLPASLIGMYLPAMAADKGVTGHRAALLLTVFGGCGIFSRLGFGYLADMNCVRRAYLMALLMVMSSVAGLFTPLYNSYSLLVFFSVIYGLFGIVFFSLVPVVIVDLVGLHKMSKTLGFVQLFQGAVLAVSHPIIGNLRDATGQYHASYYFMSAAGLSCSFLLLFTPLVVHHKRDVVAMDL